MMKERRRGRARGRGTDRERDRRRDRVRDRGRDRRLIEGVERNRTVGGGMYGRISGGIQRGIEVG
jgi:hypothetical protein